MHLPSPLLVSDNISDPPHRAPLRATYLRARSSDQFARVEGLVQMNVGAGLKGAYTTGGAVIFFEG
jgi:hypothetical protein